MSRIDWTPRDTASEPRTAETVRGNVHLDMRGLTRCWQNDGWHVYAAGPCFDTHEQAVAYRDELDREGITWKPQR